MIFKVFTVITKAFSAKSMQFKTAKEPTPNNQDQLLEAWEKLASKWSTVHAVPQKILLLDKTLLTDPKPELLHYASSNSISTSTDLLMTITNHTFPPTDSIPNGLNMLHQEESSVNKTSWTSLNTLLTTKTKEVKLLPTLSS